jgi:hypothetical protein
MPDDVRVDKAKFDGLLRKMLSTPPLPKSEVKAGKRKPKKQRAHKRLVAKR